MSPLPHSVSTPCCDSSKPVGNARRDLPFKTTLRNICQTEAIDQLVPLKTTLRQVCVLRCVPPLVAFLAVLGF